jgi:hypothetical protein
MHTQEHFAQTVKAAALAAVAAGVAVAAITGSTPEFLQQYFIDKIVAAALTLSTIYYTLTTRPAAEPAAEPPVA